MKTNEAIELEATARETGKSACRKLRAKNTIPAVVYGPTSENFHITVDEKLTTKFSKREFDNAIITLKSSDSKLNGKKVFLKTKTVHPTSRRLTHVDFLAIDMNREVRIRVELKLVGGTPKGVANGGLLQMLNRSIEVLTLPSNIPSALEIDLSGLDIGESIHASDVVLPKGVKHVAHADAITVATVTVPEAEVTAAPVAAAATDAAAAPTAGAAAPAAGAAAPAAGAKKEPAKK